MSTAENFSLYGEVTDSLANPLIISNQDGLRLSLHALKALRDLKLPAAEEILQASPEESLIPQADDNIVSLEDYRHEANSKGVQVFEDSGEILAIQEPNVSPRQERINIERRLAMAAKTDPNALEALYQRYKTFIRLKASSYFIAGGDSADVEQEASIGFYKAVRDFDGESSSFRAFADLCITRQVITAVKTATRFKHSPLNHYVSFHHTPAGHEGEDLILGDMLPGPAVNDPLVRVMSTEGLQGLIDVLVKDLSPLEADSIRLYLEGNSYEQMAVELECDAKTIDNALQRVKRKILNSGVGQDVYQ